MPLYEYQCETCHHRFEKIQKFSDPPVEECPKCAGKVKKLVSSPAIQFKGSGWYITDYAKKSSSDATKAGSAKGDSPSMDTKTETASTADSKTDPADSKPAGTAKKD